MTRCADFVAKVGGPLQVRNFRIQRARRLNQYCAAGLFFESMLRVRMRKFFLQQYLPKADIAMQRRRSPILAYCPSAKTSSAMSDNTNSSAALTGPFSHTC